MNPTNVAKFVKRKTPLGVIRKLAVDSMTVIDDVDATLTPHNILIRIMILLTLGNWKF